MLGDIRKREAPGGGGGCWYTGATTPHIRHMGGGKTGGRRRVGLKHGGGSMPGDLIKGLARVGLRQSPGKAA